MAFRFAQICAFNERLARAGTAGSFFSACSARALLSATPSFELSEQELKLLDLAVELLGGAAEARSPQHRELRLEMLDLQRLGVKLGITDGDQAVTFGELRLPFHDDLLALAQQCFLPDNHPPQRADIARKCRMVGWHAQYKNLIRAIQFTQHIVS
jgi:hypothetical protein